MTVEITERTRGLWFLELPRADYSATLEQLEAGKFQVTMRFRYYETADPWDNKDQKNWYVATGTEEAAMIEATREGIAMLKLMGGRKSWELLRGTGTLEDFINTFMKLPFVHARTIDGRDLEPEKDGKHETKRDARGN